MNNYLYAVRGLLLLMVLGVFGCASYSNSFSPIAEKLAGHDLDAALELLTKGKTPERNRLLFLLDRGMLLRMHGKFEASNQVFAGAKGLVAELNALSLREQTTAMVINDGTRSYAGAPYEQVLLNTYSALNYLELGQLDQARVEALQVDLLLGELADRDLGPLFDSDPFARYLSAIIYEANGEMSDAMIAYRSAYESYKLHAESYPLSIPVQLKIDLLRVSEAVGLTEENQQFRKVFAVDSWLSASELQREGELIFIFNNGLAPVKDEESVIIPVSKQGQLVRISLPVYQKRPKAFSHARLKISGRQFETEVFADIEEQAIAELKRNQAAILARATARAILKLQMSRQTSKQNDLAGLLLNIGGLLTERADTRSWMSLPANIQLARVALPPGEYDLSVELLSPDGIEVKQLLYPATKLLAGQKTFIDCYEVGKLSLLRSKRK